MGTHIELMNFISKDDDTFRFVPVSAPNQLRDSTARRQAHSHAVKSGLQKKRKGQQDSHRHFHIIHGYSAASRNQRSMQKGPLAALPPWSPSVGAFDPFETLAVGSSRLRVLLDDCES